MMVRPHKQLRPQDEEEENDERASLVRPNKKPRAKRANRKKATDPCQPVMLSIVGAARRWGVHRSTIERGIAAGRIKTVVLNKQRMVGPQC